MACTLAVAILVIATIKLYKHIKKKNSKRNSGNITKQNK